MKKIPARLPLLAALIGSFALGSAFADDKEIEQQFRTYQNWKPEMPAGLDGGTVINATNVDKFTEIGRAHV